METVGLYENIVEIPMTFAGQTDSVAKRSTLTRLFGVTAGRLLMEWEELPSLGQLECGRLCFKTNLTIGATREKVAPFAGAAKTPSGRVSLMDVKRGIVYAAAAAAMHCGLHTGREQRRTAADTAKRVVVAFYHQERHLS